jgi:tetratricopeptide (TPR) repeat protein
VGREERIIGGNPALQGLLDEAGLSNAALARAVVAAGAETGIHVGTNTTSAKRMLDGSQPRWPVPKLVARVLSRHLNREVGVTECGFVDRDLSNDTFNGFGCATTIDGTIATVAELSGRDIKRRNFLLGSAFTAAAFAEPALLAVTMPPEASATKAAGQRIGAADVEVTLNIVRQFEQLHRRFGGGVVRPRIVHFVHQQTQAMRDGSYGERVGRELSRAISQATWLAGLTSVDSGRHALGQRYYTQALNLAKQAGDHLYAANALAEMSRVTIDVGNAAGDRKTTQHHGQHATALARSALQVANGSATPAFGAWLYAMEARSLALLGDTRGATESMDNAQRAFDRPGAAEPDWFGFYGDPDLLADIGQCMRDTGRPQQGLALLERSAASLPAHRITARAKTQVHIAAAQLELGEFEAAETTTATALTAIGELSSNRTIDRVKALQHRAHQHGQHPRLRDMDERITSFLAGNSRSPRDGSPSV